ncbi:MAG: hypothetical protein RLZZ502_1181 [Pseudomonadota bacterium]
MKPHQKTLSLIFAVCAAPFVLAWVAYYFYQPQSKMNFGTLLPTRPLPALDTPELDGQWRVVWQQEAHCDARCTQVRHATAQLRTMTGRDRTRVGRVVLNTSVRKFDAAEGLLELPMTPELSKALSTWPEQRGQVLLIDPLFNQVLVWPVPADGQLQVKKMQQDLMRVLKASKIG